MNVLVLPSGCVWVLIGLWFPLSYNSFYYLFVVFVISCILEELSVYIFSVIDKSFEMKMKFY